MGRLPQKIPSPKPEQIIEGKAAISEAAALAADVDLSDRKKLNEINELSRKNDREDHVNRIIIGVLYFAAVLCGCMFLVLVSQYVLPARVRLLTTEEAYRLQSFLLSGAIGSGLSTAASRLSKNRK